MAQQLGFEPRGHAPSHHVILPSYSSVVESVRSGAQADCLGLSFGSSTMGKVAFIKLPPCASVFLLCKMGIIIAPPRLEMSAGLALASSLPFSHAL